MCCFLLDKWKTSSKLDKHVQNKVLNIFKIQFPSYKGGTSCLLPGSYVLKAIQSARADFIHRMEAFERVEF